MPFKPSAQGDPGASIPRRGRTRLGYQVCLFPRLEQATPFQPSQPPLHGTDAGLQGIDAGLQRANAGLQGTHAGLQRTDAGRQFLDAPTELRPHGLHVRADSIRGYEDHSPARDRHGHQANDHRGIHPRSIPAPNPCFPPTGRLAWIRRAIGGGLSQRVGSWRIQQDAGCSQWPRQLAPGDSHAAPGLGKARAQMRPPQGLRDAAAGWITGGQAGRRSGLEGRASHSRSALGQPVADGGAHRSRTLLVLDAAP